MSIEFPTFHLVNILYQNMVLFQHPYIYHKTLLIYLNRYPDANLGFMPVPAHYEGDEPTLIAGEKMAICLGYIKVFFIIHSF